MSSDASPSRNTHNLDALLIELMEKITACLDADRSSLFLYDEGREELWSKVAQGNDIKDIRVPADRGIIGEVLKTAETVNIPDAYRDDRFNPEVDRKSGYRTESILCMPVLNNTGERIGVIQVLNKHGGAFLQADEQLLGALSTHAAIAIENARLHLALLAQAEERHHLIGEYALDAIVSIDLSGEVVGWNPQAESIFGWSQDEALGRQMDEMIVPEKTREAHRSGFQRFLRTSESTYIGRRVEFEAVGRDGREFPVELTVLQPMVVNNERVITAFIRDITQMKEAEARIQRLIRELEARHEELKQQHGALLEAEQAREDLTHMIVHDMNNPLGALGGFADLMLMMIQTGVDEEMFGKYLGFISGSAKQLQSLVQGLLDISKLEAGQLRVKLEELDVAKIASDVCQGAVHQAEQAEIELVAEVGESPAHAWADADVLPRIIQNLLSNAFKYSGSGTKVEVSVGQSGDETVVKVSDSGPGVPPENQERIFDKFFQAKVEKGVRRGVGLGLAFCKMATESQGGRIWVESDVGQGTTFFVALKSSRR